MKSILFGLALFLGIFSHSTAADAIIISGMRESFNVSIDPWSDYGNVSQFTRDILAPDIGITFFISFP